MLYDQRPRLPNRCASFVFFRLRQKKIDQLKKEKGGSTGKRVGGALSALGRKLNKLTAQEDPELATEDRIEIEDDDEEEEEEVRVDILLS